jgi:RimJ/RimL family protein N-acetyltransferase
LRRLGVYHISISHGWQTLDFGVLLIRQIPAYSVLKLDPAGPNPSRPVNTDFWSLSASYDELSLVCMKDQAPTVGILDRSDDWTAFRVAGTMDFTLTGIVARISQVLADAHLGIFVVSTFDTDYILVNHNDADTAVTRWRESGIEVIEPIHQTARLDFIDINYELEDLASNNRSGKSWVDDYPTKSEMMIADLLLQAGVQSPQQTCVHFTLRSRSTGMALGGVGFKGEHIDGDFCAMEIHYSLAESVHRKGFGTEAVAGLIAIARERGMTQLCAETDFANLASQKVLMRNGFSELSHSDTGIWWGLSILD